MSPFVLEKIEVLSLVGSNLDQPYNLFDGKKSIFPNLNKIIASSQRIDLFPPMSSLFKDGKGVFISQLGEKYEGVWKDKRFSGTATFTSQMAAELGFKELKRTYADGVLQRTFTCVSDNGNKYQGEMINNTYCGIGTLTWKSGEKYEGNWLNGMPHGQGTYTYSDGSKYEGDWLGAMQHGQGTYIYSDGSKYEGDWLDGMQHGQGTYTYPDGSKYEGKWEYNERHGQGTYTFENGDRYEEK